MYSKIEVHGGCDINYLHIKKDVETTSQIANVVNQGLVTPEWGLDTTMLANYQGSTDGTPLQISDGVVVGYQIQRYDVKKNIMSYVAKTSEGKIKDYIVNNGRDYQYYIFPIIKTDNGNILGSPIVTDKITPLWDMCTIVGLIETENKNEYIVDRDNIWRLQLNVERENYELNMDKTFTDGFDRFPKKTQGIKKYITSGVNSIVGQLMCPEDKIDFDISDIERWEDFCYSPNLKLFNDMHGRIIPIDIKQASTGYLDSVVSPPLVTKISFVQLADINDITVCGLDGE